MSSCNSHQIIASNNRSGLFPAGARSPVPGKWSSTHDSRDHFLRLFSNYPAVESSRTTAVFPKTMPASSPSKIRKADRLLQNVYLVGIPAPERLSPKKNQKSGGRRTSSSEQARSLNLTRSVDSSSLSRDSGVDGQRPASRSEVLTTIAPEERAKALSSRQQKRGAAQKDRQKTIRGRVAALHPAAGATGVHQLPSSPKKKAVGSSRAGPPPPHHAPHGGGAGAGGASLLSSRERNVNSLRSLLMRSPSPAKRGSGFLSMEQVLKEYRSRSFYQLSPDGATLLRAPITPYAEREVAYT